MLIRTNVTNIGDPFVVTTEQGYIMYATTFDAMGYRCYLSDDLRNWTDGGVVLDMTGSWANQDFWAPEVICRSSDGKYVMHFTARRACDKSLRIGVAIADKPEGPFVQPQDAPMFDFGYAAIDGHVFVDEDGQAWLYYSRDCSENIVNGLNISQLYVVRLSEDLTQVIGEPVLLTTPTYDYENMRTGNYMWNEGAAVLKREGKYFLFYSANFYASKNYCVNVAVSDSPDGPFEKLHSVNPILHSGMQPDDFSGPGHNCFFYDKEGSLKSAFHIHTDEHHPSGDRRAAIADVVFEDGVWRFAL